MNLAKTLVPVALAFAAFGAQATTIETHYPANVQATQAAPATGASAGVLVQPISEAAPAFSGLDQPTAGRSRADVRREAQQPRQVSPDSFFFA